MSKSKSRIRTVDRRVLYSPEELKRLYELFSKSAYKTLNEYIRRKSLNRPVKIIHRNVSLDNLIDELIKVRRTMEEIRIWLPTDGVKTFHVIQVQQECKEIINKIANLCMAK
jgi:hypothetical protein